MKTKSSPLPKSAKSGRVVIVDEDADALPPEALPKLDSGEVEDMEAVSDFLTQFAGKNYRVRVEQFNRDEKDWDHIETYQLEGFDAYETCKTLGPGKYRLTVLNEGGKYIKNGPRPVIRIGGSVKAAPGVIVTDNQNPFANPAVVMMLESMKASNAQAVDMMKAILLRPQEPTKAPTLTELIASVASLKSLGPSEAKGGLKETLELLSLAKDLVGNNEDSGGEEKGFMAQLQDALKAAKEMGILDPARVRERLSAPQRIPQPGAAPMPTVVINPLPVEIPKVESPVMLALRPYITIFTQKAEQQVPVDDAADFLVAEVWSSIVPLIKKTVPMAKFVSEDLIVDNLVNQAGSAEQLENIFAYAPELLAHREWVLQVVAKAITNLNSNGDQPDGALPN